MPKKNKKPQAIDFGQVEDTSATNHPVTEPAAAEEDTAVSSPDTRPAETTPVDPQNTSAEGSGAELPDTPQPMEEDESLDELLDDVRRSLIEDETQTEEEKQAA